MSHNENATVNGTSFISDRIVRATYSWRPSENGPRTFKTSTFDFSGCSDQQIIQLAMYGAKVKVQSLLRDIARSNDGAVPDTAYTNVDVLADVIETRRKEADPVAKALQLLKQAGLNTDAILSQISDK